MRQVERRGLNRADHVKVVGNVVVGRKASAFQETGRILIVGQQVLIIGEQLFDKSQILIELDVRFFIVFSGYRIF